MSDSDGGENHIARTVVVKISRLCQFTLNEPTKRRTDAVEF